MNGKPIIMNYVQRIESFFINALDTLYPIRSGKSITENTCTISLEKELLQVLQINIEEVKNPEQVTKDFLAALPKIKYEITKDIVSIYEGDPAAKSQNEIILAYPCLLYTSPSPRDGLLSRMPSSA